MAMVGVLYILFENSILYTTGNSKGPAPTLDDMSKVILGLQVGLIMLAMVVTRSSVASLAARKGLPLGNQVTGWLVLGGLSSIMQAHTYTD